MAGVLEDRSIDLHERHLRRPRPFPRRRIGDGELIADLVVAEARKALDHLHVLAGPAECHLVVEVGRLDHQRVAFPVSSRVAEPRAHVGRRVRPTVGGNHADFVEHLDQDHDRALALHDLIRRVVSGRHHRRLPPA
jgi:hypothetical protein